MDPKAKQSRHFVLRRPGDAEVRARVPSAPGETLYNAAERFGKPVRTRCQASVICGQCWVVVEEGFDELAPPTEDELMLVGRTSRGAPRARLSCRLTIPEGRSTLVVAADYF